MSDLKIEAAIPARHPMTSSKQDYTRTIVAKQSNGTYQITETHYIVTTYDNRGKISIVNNSHNFSYTV